MKCCSHSLKALMMRGTGVGRQEKAKKWVSPAGLAGGTAGHGQVLSSLDRREALRMLSGKMGNGEEEEQWSRFTHYSTFI